MIMYTLSEPKTKLHESLLRCVRGCFCEIDFLKKDIERGRKTKPIVCGDNPS
jgi:hypothetical protein